MSCLARHFPAAPLAWEGGEQGASSLTQPALVHCPLPRGEGRLAEGETHASFSILRHGAEVVIEDRVSAPTNFAAVLRPHALPPVAEAARLGHEQVEQGVA